MTGVQNVFIDRIGKKEKVNCRQTDLGIIQVLTDKISEVSELIIYY